MLVIEIDGTSHLYKKSYDDNRAKFLESFGLKILRYDDMQVLNNFHLVEEDFKEKIKEREKEIFSS